VAAVSFQKNRCRINICAKLRNKHTTGYVTKCVDDINTNGRCLLTAFRIRRRFVTALPIFKKYHMYIVRKITPAVEKITEQTHVTKHVIKTNPDTCCLHDSQIATERQLPCKPESGHVVLVHIVHFDLCGRSTGGQRVGWVIVHMTPKAFINELNSKIFAPKYQNIIFIISK
jgi:hypothetical protein